MAPQGLGTHPQLEKILECAIAGQSARHISTWAIPRVAHNTLSRFLKARLAPALAQADAYLSVAPPPAPNPGNTGKGKNQLKNQQVTKEEFDALAEDFPAMEQSMDQQKQVERLAIDALVATPVLQIRENRIKAKLDRHRRMQMVIDARAEAHANVPGGKSGLLVRDFKGENEVYKFDAALVAAMTEEEKAIAIELGQWQENAGGSVSIQIVSPAVSINAMPRVVFAQDDHGLIEAAVIEDDDPIASIGVIQRP